jgi:hypothetical protein
VCNEEQFVALLRNRADASEWPQSRLSQVRPQTCDFMGDCGDASMASPMSGAATPRDSCDSGSDSDSCSADVDGLPSVSAVAGAIPNMSFSFTAGPLSSQQPLQPHAARYGHVPADVLPVVALAERENGGGGGGASQSATEEPATDALSHVSFGEGGGAAPAPTRRAEDDALCVRPPVVGGVVSTRRQPHSVEELFDALRQAPRGGYNVDQLVIECDDDHLRFLQSSSRLGAGRQGEPLCIGSGSSN